MKEAAVWATAGRRKTWRVKAQSIDDWMAASAVRPVPSIQLSGIERRLSEPTSRNVCELGSDRKNECFVTKSVPDLLDVGTAAAGGTWSRFRSKSRIFSGIYHCYEETPGLKVAIYHYLSAFESLSQKMKLILWAVGDHIPQFAALPDRNARNVCGDATQASSDKESL